MTTERECSWTATSETSWLSITSSSNGQGDGFIEFRVAANGDPVERNGSLMLNNQRAQISQAAGVCAIELRDHSANLSQSGGSGVVNVVASSPMCTWTANSDADWISISSATGKGTASVPFVVAPATGPPRTGTITVAGQRFSVTQSEGCSYSIDPQAQSFGATGGTATVAVSSAPGCPWVSGANVPWIAVTQGAAGSGPGTVSFSVEGTAGPTRTGTLVIAGNPFTVSQSPGCSFQVSPTTHSVDAAGGSRTVSVAAAAGCSWSAGSGEPWISITGSATGSGNGTVTFSVQQATGPGRTGTLTVADQTITVNQSQGCSFAIAPESRSVDAAGGTGEVTVTGVSGCSWSASSNASWITITQGTSGTGNGTVRYSAASTTGGTRTGTLTIAGRTFTLTQSQSCTVTLSADTTTVPAGGGTRTFNVQAATGCSWSATSGASWITVTQGSTGSGNGSVSLNVAPNTGAPRTGTVTVGNRTFTVQQESGCSYALSSDRASMPISGGSGSVGVTTTAGCTWTAASSATWVTITSGATGAGNGTVAFSVAANSGPARTATLTIGGRTFTIDEASACAYSISPQQQSVAASGGAVAVAVTTTAGCTWTAAANVPWITVTQGAIGSGNGNVSLSINSSTEPARTGSATIAGRTFTVQQASGCTFGVSPSSRIVDASGGSNMFNVSASSSCPWSAVSEVLWITITTGDSANGNTKVDYTVARNTGPARTGTIRVGNAVFTVMQSGS